MAREALEDKAVRYLRERRLAVTHVAGGEVLAVCRGSGGEEYRVGFDPHRVDWFCTCPAPRRCAHLLALQMVTIRKRGR